MTALRSEVRWVICFRLGSNRGWAPFLRADYASRKTAMAALEEMIARNPEMRDELAVCRATLIVERWSAKQLKVKR